MECTQEMNLSSQSEENASWPPDPEAAVGYLQMGEKQYPIKKGTNTIGRDSDQCSVVLESKALSKVHCTIEVENNHTHLICDMESRNKTKLNKMFLKPKVRYSLQDGDQLKLADIICTYIKVDIQPEPEKEADSDSETDAEISLKFDDTEDFSSVSKSDVSASMIAVTPAVKKKDANGSLISPERSLAKSSADDDESDTGDEEVILFANVKSHSEDSGKPLSEKSHVADSKSGDSKNEAGESKIDEDDDIFNAPTQPLDFDSKNKAGDSKIDEDDDIFNAPTQPTDFDSKSSNSKKEAGESKIDADDDIFDAPTQPLDFDSKNKAGDSKIEDDDDIFNAATQPIDFDSKGSDSKNEAGESKIDEDVLFDAPTQVNESLIPRQRFVQSSSPEKSSGLPPDIYDAETQLIEKPNPPPVDCSESQLLDTETQLVFGPSSNRSNDQTEDYIDEDIYNMDTQPLEPQTTKDKKTDGLDSPKIKKSILAKDVDPAATEDDLACALTQVAGSSREINSEEEEDSISSDALTQPDSVADDLAEAETQMIVMIDSPRKRLDGGSSSKEVVHQNSDTSHVSNKGNAVKDATNKGKAAAEVGEKNIAKKDVGRDDTLTHVVPSNDLSEMATQPVETPNEEEKEEEDLDDDYCNAATQIMGEDPEELDLTDDLKAIGNKSETDGRLKVTDGKRNVPDDSLDATDSKIKTTGDKMGTTEAKSKPAASKMNTSNKLNARGNLRKGRLTYGTRSGASNMDGELSEDFIDTQPANQSGIGTQSVNQNENVSVNPEAATQPNPTDHSYCMQVKKEVEKKKPVPSKPVSSRLANPRSSASKPAILKPPTSKPSPQKRKLPYSSTPKPQVTVPDDTDDDASLTLDDSDAPSESPVEKTPEKSPPKRRYRKPAPGKESNDKLTDSQEDAARSRSGRAIRPRRRYSPSGDSQSETEQDSTSALSVTPIRKGRGRPRKTSDATPEEKITASASKKPSTDEDLQESGFEKSPPLTRNESVPTRTTPGRPGRKRKIDDSQESVTKKSRSEITKSTPATKTEATKITLATKASPAAKTEATKVTLTTKTTVVTKTEATKIAPATKASPISKTEPNKMSPAAKVSLPTKVTPSVKAAATKVTPSAKAAATKVTPPAKESAKVASVTEVEGQKELPRRALRMRATPDAASRSTSKTTSKSETTPKQATKVTPKDDVSRPGTRTRGQSDITSVGKRKKSDSQPEPTKRQKLEVEKPPEAVTRTSTRRARTVEPASKSSPKTLPRTTRKAATPKTLASPPQVVPKEKILKTTTRMSSRAARKVVASPPPKAVSKSTPEKVTPSKVVTKPMPKRGAKPLPQASPAASQVSTRGRNKNATATTRKRGTALFQEAAEHKVMFTGLEDYEMEAEMVEKLGGIITDSLTDCTVLVTDAVRRTVKFMCALGRGVPIVSTSWLHQSSKGKGFKDPWDFIVSDVKMERKYKFKLVASLKKAGDGGLLVGYSVMCTPGIKPPPSEMKEIIKCAGGSAVTSVPKGAKMSFAVTCQEDEKKWATLQKKGIELVQTEGILTGLLQQKLDLKKFALG